VQQRLEDCDPDNMWLQIPFFCGHSPACWEKGSEWALEEAKKNLLEHYMLVGVTEQMEDFINLLELTLPSMFHGAAQHFASSKSHVYKLISVNYAENYSASVIISYANKESSFLLLKTTRLFNHIRLFDLN
jgi:hypothetical protein